MSISAMSYVWDHSKQEGGNLLVMLALADYSNEQGLSWPSNKVLARKARLSPRQVQRVTGELEAAGELEILVGQGPNGTNFYKINRGGVIVSPHDNGTEKGDDTHVAQTTKESSIIEVAEAAPPFRLEVEAIKNGEKRKADSIFSDLLPDLWLRSSSIGMAWRGFVEMRRAIKKPLTERAVTLTVSKVVELVSAAYKFVDHERMIVAILDQSTTHNWQGVFDLKQDAAKPSPQQAAKKDTEPERYQEFIAGHPTASFRTKFARWSDSSDPSLSGIRLQFGRWLKNGRYE